MQRGLAMRKLLSVRLSFKRVICDRTKEMCANILKSHERPFTPIFMTRRMVGRGHPSTWNFGSNWPRLSENANLQSIFARRAPAVTPSEKVQSKLIGNPLRSFQW